MHIHHGVILSQGIARTDRSVDRRMRSFFLLAFGFSWLFWIPAALIGKPVMEFPWMLLVIGGGLGPALAAGFLLLRSGSSEQRDYLTRLMDLRRIRPAWWAVIALTLPIIDAAAVLLDAWINGSAPTFPAVQGYLKAPLQLIPFALGIFLFGPLPEELGWRGFALDALQSRWNALASSLVLGAAWALWHLPLFFMRGAYQNQIGFATPGFWWFSASTLVCSIFYTWIYNNTCRSTLAAILFHFTTNFSGELFSLNGQARTYQGIALLVLAALVIWQYRPATLTGRS